jgi:hypothetical protein
VFSLNLFVVNVFMFSVGEPFEYDIWGRMLNQTSDLLRTHLTNLCLLIQVPFLVSVPHFRNASTASGAGHHLGVQPHLRVQPPLHPTSRSCQAGFIHIHHTVFLSEMASIYLFNVEYGDCALWILFYSTT